MSLIQHEQFFVIFSKGQYLVELLRVLNLHIAENANTNEDSFANLGNNFKHPEYEFSSKEAESFLAGSEKFRLNEIEVYSRS
jgi:hypothetical protein